jgi:hypothetical protein
MTESIKPKANDQPLSQAQAMAGTEITSTDIARIRAKWRRRVPDFEARIKRAAGEQNAGTD